MDRHDVARQLFVQLRDALDDDLLDEDEIRACIGILRAAAERVARGGFTAVPVDEN